MSETFLIPRSSHGKGEPENDSQEHQGGKKFKKKNQDGSHGCEIMVLP